MRQKEAWKQVFLPQTLRNTSMIIYKTILLLKQLHSTAMAVVTKVLTTFLQMHCVTFRVKKSIIIIQYFLEKGHTQIEVDSAHSLIKHKLKNRHIKLLSYYISFCKQFRFKQNFHVKYLSYEYFFHFSTVYYYNSIRLGFKTQLEVFKIFTKMWNTIQVEL